MSELILPPGYQRTPQSDAFALKRANEAAAVEDIEPYYSERAKIYAAADKLNRIFAWSGEEPWTQRQYEQAAENLFGDAGMLVKVEWLQAYDPTTGEELPFKVPNVRFIGRVDKAKERDHDRIRHEIVTGQGPDGVAGYIREDGSRREDPIKKVIT